MPDSLLPESVWSDLEPGQRPWLEGVASNARTAYGEQMLESGESVWRHAVGMSVLAAELRLDATARAAALLFAFPGQPGFQRESFEQQYGSDVSRLVRGVFKLNQMRPITQGFATDAVLNPQDLKAQVEILRKMLLAMVEDVRVVLLRLASRTQTLRFYAQNPDPERLSVARETLDLLAPLANRLGVWELKWELEDLSFRFLHPDTYREIARKLDEKRLEREAFIAHAVGRVKAALHERGVEADVYGRPKHIYSIWNKMQRKGLGFDELYDVRALRIVVGTISDCYTALGYVHQIWTPIPSEFDDYISQPKGNDYRSLHTAVRCEDGRALEIQIRTQDMHQHAELGVAAHWRYKEGAGSGGSYDDKIALLRQLLSWREDIDDSRDWQKHYREAALDDTLYVFTPQGRVVDLPVGSTPVDFAYRVHTELGHRCRGAKIDGALVPLTTPLRTGQRVEIVSAKEGGPSRDWLNPQQGYLMTKSARTKVRNWFATQALDETISSGRSMVSREMQRVGGLHASLDQVAHSLGFHKIDDLFIAVGRDEIGLRSLQQAIRGEISRGSDAEQHELPLSDIPPETMIRRSRHRGGSGVLIVGVDQLMTQLARCCKPVPPDHIQGFVTREKGISIHRQDCPSFLHVAALHPERVIEADWSDAGAPGAEADVYGVDILVDAQDRQGLLRDISDVLAREKVNVTAVRTQSKHGAAEMAFTVEVVDLKRLNQALMQIRLVNGVLSARRG
ncbi:MAG: bifunctional (p)ppGpp synthetase/guanosine-3',5'-bis(diphosphate) 3'-pyrophosphohydrolase [Rhodocyclaceae bacterium]|nr:bifunctional (p)ppGpp synthetase/guanosine-3',5'-bis(diphosphate) 3'-pyrophosphohydrolase [Rhodocyclaceae bacterium]